MHNDGVWLAGLFNLRSGPQAQHWPLIFCLKQRAAMWFFSFS